MPRNPIRIVIGIVLMLPLLACVHSRVRSATSLQPQNASSTYFLTVDARAGGFAYAYAPSIILKNGTYHMFFCSKGWINYPSWDAIRYTTSTDGRHWSSPKVVLQATATSGMDLAACDPSLVFYRGFYYLYYSSAVTTSPHNFQTVIQVARSPDIEGPYKTYTQRGTWEPTPRDPKVLIEPLQMHRTQPTGYGAGQQSVIVHNGELVMWYTDDSIFVSGQPEVRTYMLQSSDPTTWVPGQGHATNLVNEASIDVKYDSAKDRFVMIRVEREFSSKSYLARAYSIDGLAWSVPETVFPASIFPRYTHDAGIAADETGNLVPTPTLIGFGAPYDLADANHWAEWNLYAAYIDDATSSP
jgi:hypothetical protein